MTNKIQKNLESSNQGVNLCQDLMFKVFFTKNEHLLPSLIQSCISFPKGKIIQNLEIKNKKDTQDLIKQTKMFLRNPSMYPKFPGGKGVVLDILVTLNTGESVNIEMQTLYHTHLQERILYYWSEIYGADLKSGEGYDALKPAYSLVFVDFPLLKKSLGFLNSFSVLLNKPPHVPLTDHLSITIADLSHFSVPEGGLVLPEHLSKGSGPLFTSVDKMLDMARAWCYFIKWSSKLTNEGLKALTKQSEVFKMAEVALKELSVDSSVRTLEKLREKWVRDQKSNLKQAELKGIEKGRIVGRQEERQMRDKQIVLNMLKNRLDTDLICKVTGLSQQEINKLKNGS